MTHARFPWLITFVTLVFAAGLATGVLLQQTLQPVPVARELPMRPSPAALVTMLGEELQLTSTQQARLQQLVMNRRQASATSRAEIRERMSEEASGLHDEIRTNLDLTPEQRERFEAFVTRVRARFLSDAPPH